jgi:hypothetical protein
MLDLLALKVYKVWSVLQGQQALKVFKATQALLVRQVHKEYKG